MPDTVFSRPNTAATEEIRAVLAKPALYEDGRAAIDFLKTRTASIVLHGYSLGSGVAVQLATERGAAALILESPYTSITDVAVRRFPFVPVRWLVRDRFENLKKIEKIALPAAIYCGGADPVIPPEHARMLFAAAPEPKRILVIPDAGHTDAWTRGGAEFVFISWRSSPPRKCQGSTNLRENRPRPSLPRFLWIGLHRSKLPRLFQQLDYFLVGGLRKITIMRPDGEEWLRRHQADNLVRLRRQDLDRLARAHRNG